MSPLQNPLAECDLQDVASRMAQYKEIQGQAQGDVSGLTREYLRLLGSWTSGAAVPCAVTGPVLAYGLDAPLGEVNAFCTAD